jgi:hypothetical protein
MYELNADNFRRWIRNHSEEKEKNSDMTGLEVQAKFSAKKIIKNMCVENGKAGRVIREFMESGGTVKDVSGDEYLVSVPSGEFTINKKFLTT